MELRRRIIIPTDGSIPDPLPTPHFDSDAAISARPVRPIGYAEETTVDPRLAAPLGYVACPKKRSRIWPVVIVLLIFLAGGGGLAGGYGIAHYGTPATPEPILAAATIHTDDAGPEMVFTAPPDEEVAAETDPADPDAEPVDGEGQPDGGGVELDPDGFPRGPSEPRNGPPTTPPNRRMPTVSAPPDDEIENSRPRRAPEDGQRNTTARRRDNSSRDDSTTSGQIRRAGRGMVSRIREIFEGKP
jgi:hypothetical protein